MKENKRKLGHKEEIMACDFLENKGYDILGMNYHCRYGEIDVIARDGRYIVFAEVKYRASAGAGFPQEAVTPKKQRNISFVARYFLMSKKYAPGTPVRFDVIAILGSEITHIVNAFEPC